MLLLFQTFLKLIIDTPFKQWQMETFQVHMAKGKKPRIRYN